MLTDEGLPTSICKKCIEYATVAYKFKVNCERTESLLQNYVARRSTEDLSNKFNHESDEIPTEIRVEFNSDTQEENQNLTLNLADEQEELNEHINDNQILHNEEQDPLEEDKEKQCFQVLQLTSEMDIIKEEYETQEFQEDNEDDQEQFHEDENEQMCEGKVMVVTGTDLENVLNDNELENMNPEVLDEVNGEDSEEFLDAANVASSEDNIKLREKIEMKKKKLLENESDDEQVKIKKQYYQNSTFNEKGNGM